MDENQKIENKEWLFRNYNLVGSMNQATSPYLMDDTDFLYTRNVSRNEIGVMQKDGGYSKWSGTDAGAGTVDFLFDYVTTDGVHTMLKIVNGTLRKSTGTNWSDVSVDEFTADKWGSGANFLDRCYIATEDKVLKYTDGSSVTDLTPADLKGKYLAVFGDVLYMGGLTAVHEKNEVVYTKAGTHQFYKDSDGAYADTTNIIPVDGEVKGLCVFRGLLYIFTDTHIWYHNPSTLETKPFYNHGTTSHWSIIELEGNLVWVDRTGAHVFSGEGVPVNFSRWIQNRNINSAWYSIDGDNWGKITSGVKDGILYISVGTLTATLPGDSGALSDVVFTYNYQMNAWDLLDTHPAYQWANFIDGNGDEQLIFGGSTSENTYVRDYGFQHDGAAITMVLRTKYYDMGIPESEKVYSDLFVTYRPQNQTAEYITVKVSVNGTNSYEEKIGSTTSAKLSLSGATTYSHTVKRVQLSNTKGHNISYEFSNSSDAVNSPIVGFSQKYLVEGFNLNIST